MTIALSTSYVLGFMFNEDKSQVALIKKSKPEWQKGKLNGIGGKVEPLETDPIFTMTREFMEETGHIHGRWTPFCIMSGKSFNVYCFVTTGDLEKLKTTTDEEVVIFNTKDISISRPLMLTNVPWLIEMALDKLTHNEFVIATISYK